MLFNDSFKLNKWFSVTSNPPSEPLSEEVNLIHFRQMLATLFQMAWFVEARDPYTGGHLWRVSRYAQLLATEAGYSDVLVAQAGLGGFLHDIGKIGIPDAILRKPGKLTDAEYAIIKTHPDIGLRMLASHPLMSLVSDGVHLHHERPDGKGYPLALTRDVIPAIAKVIGICDAFDAMTSYRPYRKGMSIEHALNELRNNAGTQFDERLVPKMEILWQQGKLQHIQGHSDDGIQLQQCVMCGPTLVLTREHAKGDHLYCSNCTGEYVLEPDDEGRLSVVATGEMGTPKDLEPQADQRLIAAVIAESVRALPVAELLRSYANPAARPTDAS